VPASSPVPPRPDLRAALRDALGAHVDGVLAEHDFVRRPRSTTYKRAVDDGSQTIDLDLWVRPKPFPGAQAVVVGAVRIVQATLETWVAAMIPEQVRRVHGGLTLGQPFDLLVDPKDRVAFFGPRKVWLAQRLGEIDATVEGARRFLAEVVVPFADSYRSATDLVAGYHRRDPRLSIDEALHVRVVICHLVAGQIAEARQVLETRLAGDLPRTLYAKLWDAVGAAPDSA
jgi:hypothetical protein